MALSGTLTKAYRGWTYRLAWSATQSVDKNQSTVTCKHYLDCAASYSLYIGTRTNSCTVGGVKRNFTSPKISTGGGSTITLGTTTHTLTHNSDGSLKANISSTFNIDATLSGTYKGSIAVSGTITLNTIARASQPSCITWPEHTQNVGDFGDTISIHMNRKSDSFTHTVRYAYGTLTGTIATNVGTGTTWTIPLSFMDLIPNATKGSGTIYVDTYNGTTKIGTKSCGFTAQVPSGVKPSCSLQVLDATDIQETYGNLVKGLSKLYVKATGTPAYSSPIQTYTIEANGEKHSSAAAEITTDVLSEAGTTTVKASVTDQRGRTSPTASASFTVLDYTRPTISKVAVHRCDADGTENDQGEYVKVQFSATITPLNNLNSHMYTLHWKKSTETDWEGNIAIMKMDWANQYEVVDWSHTFAADSDYAYDVEVRARDAFYTTAHRTSVSTGYTFMDWDDKGKSLAFGKVAEEERTFENALALRQIGNRYAFSTPGVASQAGIICMARIKIIAANADTPITFVFSRRQSESTMTVHVQFRNSTAETSSVASVRYEGSNYGAYVAPGDDELTWDLYVSKGSAYDTVTLQDWYTSKSMQSRVEVTFPGGIVDAVPTPFWRAGPLVAESILDCFMPVGYVLILYSHADPNELYPGSTWVRIENAFLWGCDENGDIGTTGGSKTHTLTVNELPSHSHILRVAHENTGDTTLTTSTTMYRNTNGKTQYYGSLQTEGAGSGAAHNNMPPYVQVSIWRRTA